MAQGRRAEGGHQKVGDPLAVSFPGGESGPTEAATEERDLAEVKVWKLLPGEREKLWIRNGTHRTPRAQPRPVAPLFSVAEFSPAAAAVQHAGWGGVGWRGHRKAELEGTGGQGEAVAWIKWKGKGARDCALSGVTDTGRLEAAPRRVYMATGGKRNAA